VAVEPLAKALRATKGSCYWHLADRNALLQATLELWDRRDADQVLAGFAETQDAATKLRNLVDWPSCQSSGERTKAPAPSSLHSSPCDLLEPNDSLLPNKEYSWSRPP
jgi:hypothetical protein